MSPSLRVVLLGAGSSYAPVLFSQLRVLLPHADLHLEMYDVDPESARSAAELAKMVLPEAGVGSGEEARGALAGADVVVHLYRAGPPDYRRQQEIAARNLGLIGQETQGFGGAASAMCNLAALRQIALDSVEACPGALHLFITNPTGVMTAAAAELGLSAVGLCELPYVLQRACDEVCGMGTRLDYVGLNHFAWIVGGRDGDGGDCGEALLDNAARILAESRPPNIPLPIPERTVQLFDAIPSPYLAYYYATEAALDLQRTNGTRAERVTEVNRRTQEALARSDLAEALEISRNRGGHMLGEALGAFLLAWLGVEEREMILCSSEGGGTDSRTAGPLACEMPAAVSAGSILPRPVEARLHPHLSAMLSVMEAYESLLVRAGLDEDLDVFEQALLTHPLVRDAEASRTLTRFHAEQRAPQRS